VGVTLLSNASGQITISGLNAGSYTSFTVSFAGCSSNTLLGPISLTDPGTPAISLGTTSNPTNCAGLNGSIQITGLSASTSYTVNYLDDTNPVGVTLVSNASGEITISGLNAGSYSSISVSFAGCSSNTIVGPINLIDPSTLTISLGITSNPTNCAGLNGSIQITGLAASTSYTVNYLDDANPVGVTLVSNASGEITITGLNAGSYSSVSVTLTGCSSNTIVGPINLTDPGATVISLGITSNPTGCSAANASIQIIGLTALTSYTVNYLDDVNPVGVTLVSNASGQITISGLNAGSYTNISVSLSGCTSNTLAGPINFTDPGVPAIVLGATSNPISCSVSDASIQITGLIASTAYSVNYIDDTNPVGATLTSNTSGEITISGLNVGSYTNINVTIGGCISNNLAVTLTANCEELEIPEAFTPDGDGINDGFVILGIENFPNNEIVIFNRWGNIVYQATGYNNDWVGNSTNKLNISGNQLPTGTYYYVLDTKNAKVGVLKGYIYIER
jgi:gliding motility-associated-like protein